MHLILRFYWSLFLSFIYFSCVQGFKKLQQMIFSQLNEKMRAMDRSLLEKIGADIEMMDKEQGLSPIHPSFIFHIFNFFLSFLCFNASVYFTKVKAVKWLLWGVKRCLRLHWKAYGSFHNKIWWIIIFTFISAVQKIPVGSWAFKFISFGIFPNVVSSRGKTL